MLETIVVGNIGSVRFARAGETSVLNLSVASSRKINDREFTDWISAKLWGARGEKLREHVSVGMKILLKGRPEAKGFQKGDGTVAGELVLHVNELEFLSAKAKPPQPEQLPLEPPPATKPKKRKADTP
ncbi:MAG: single-stranded DNA-binding protein [Terrimicrobiaceae bacterium]|nr:single-stranded DNA-binding protein [Terrimicrobiaceae bacterium]